MVKTKYKLTNVYTQKVKREDNKDMQTYSKLEIIHK